MCSFSLKNTTAYITVNYVNYNNKGLEEFEGFIWMS